MLRYLPIALTLARGACGPLVFALLYFGPERLAFSLFVVAALTDLIDGRLAEAVGSNRQLGALLDPICDKVLGTSAWLGLWHLSWCPPWLAGAMLARDLLTAGAWLIFAKNGLRHEAHPWGQVATSFEGASLGILLFHGPFLDTHWPSVGTWVGLTAIFMSLATSVRYAQSSYQFFRSHG